MALMRPTSSLFTWPMSTASTTLHDVLGGVAQAVDELHGDLQLLQHFVDARSAAVAEGRASCQQQA